MDILIYKNWLIQKFELIDDIKKILKSYIYKYYNFIIFDPPSIYEINPNKRLVKLENGLILLHNNYDIYSYNNCEVKKLRRFTIDKDGICFEYTSRYGTKYYTISNDQYIDVYVNKCYKGTDWRDKSTFYTKKSKIIILQYII